MNLETHANHTRPTGPARAIAIARDRIQARLLVAVAGGALLAVAASLLRLQPALNPDNSSLFVAIGVSWTFGLLVWALRAATPAAALFGSIVCFVICHSTAVPGESLAHSGLTPLAALFVLTFLATRLGQDRKQKLGLAESRHGRNAAQVIANLGAAALAASIPRLLSVHHRQPLPDLDFGAVLMLAALAEATADTLSSEIGQAFGGDPRSILRLHVVPPGTDGAITLTGTSAGIAGAALITAAGAIALRLNLQSASIACSAAVAGLLFDSLLGATIERRGWLGNDLVNFSSTLFALLCAFLLLSLR